MNLVINSIIITNISGKKTCLQVIVIHSNYEAFAAELLENLELMFPWYRVTILISIRQCKPNI